MSSLSENNIFLTYPMKTLSSESLSSTKSEMELSVNETRVNEIWTKSTFTNRLNQRKDLSLNLDNTKMSWSYQDKIMDECDNVEEKEEKTEVEVKTPTTPDQEVASPSHHARRPMNAFLIFCKKHRPIVRNKYPNLENRGVTRILGEWWALLDADDKGSYTTLAKEYKDAFFSANPNFKWYKLPAPPLRTLQVRPINIKQETSPPMSPTNILSPTSEFTPGKLADESQLGSLSSLLNASKNYTNKTNELYSKQSIEACSDLIETSLCNNNNQTENNNHEDFTLSLQSPISINQSNLLPPKPLKKRYSENFPDNKNISRNLFECKSESDEQSMTNDSNVNMTIQDEDIEFDKNGFKDTRKSGRKGKGNRYEELMKKGKLLKNKRDKRDCMQNIFETPKLDLNNTIKRLEERIQPKVNDEVSTQERERTISEMSESDDYSKAIPSFNLDQHILELPTLSYETYVQRKKESKKRKFVRNKQENKMKLDGTVHAPNNPIGSKKRKNKHNITHLEKTNNYTTFDNDLSGLTTLAEIAANKEKIIDST